MSDTFCWTLLCECLAILVPHSCQPWHDRLLRRTGVVFQFSLGNSLGSVCGKLKMKVRLRLRGDSLPLCKSLPRIPLSVVNRRGRSACRCLASTANVLLYGGTEWACLSYFWCTLVFFCGFKGKPKGAPQPETSYPFLVQLLFFPPSPRKIIEHIY